MKTTARFLFALSLLSFELARIHAQGPNEDICSVVTDSYGPLPPPVPESFIMKAEFVDRENGFLSWEEMYFDSLNLRAKYKTVSEGKEFHYIFDYDVEQILEYVVFHPGVDAENDEGALESCSASSMEDNPMHRIFGYRYEKENAKRSRMYNSFEVLQFGGNYRYAFNGTKKLPDRGIPSDSYHGCFFNSKPKMTVDKTFFWSGREKVIPANGIDQVPVRIDTYGEIFIYPKMDGKEVKLDIWQIENIPWFVGNPVFDERVFQIPRGMYCKNYRKVKDLPKLPKYFSGCLEAITYKRNFDGKLEDVIFEDFTELWYDSVSNMARVDFFANIEDDPELFLYMGGVPMYGVYDVSNGVVYYTNKLTGECVPFPIPQNFFLLSKDSTRKLAQPDEVFGFDVDNLEYKGKNFARNIPSHVWAGQKLQPDGSEDFVEVYFAADGWHTDSGEDEEFGFPVRITMIEFSTESNKTFETVEETNIFKYKATQPPSSVYDISGCLNTQNQKYYFFSIEKTARNFLDDREKFLIAVRQAITDFSHIGSPLRVQNVDIYVPSSQKNIIISFSLMDTPQLHGKPTKEPGTPLIVAEANLRKAIDYGDFVIEIVVDSKKEPQMIRALPKSLVVAIPQAEPQSDETLKYEEWDTKTPDAPTKEESIQYHYPLDEREGSLQVPDLMFSDSKDKAQDGYSSGSMGGLAFGMLVVGILLGIGVMYFYVKKYGVQEPRHEIMMHEKN